jgi:hypothetical protein
MSKRAAASRGAWVDDATAFDGALSCTGQVRAAARVRFPAAVLLLCAVLLLSGCQLPSRRPPPTVVPGSPNPIVAENRHPGTDAWRFGKPGFQTADDRGQQIKGYAGAVSVNLNEAIKFYVTVSPAQNYTIDVYRMGWYGGQGGRLMQHIGPLDGVEQPRCPVDATTGLIACAWTPAYTLTVPADWTSGIYMAVLTNAQHYQNRIMFAVRDDARRAALLFQQPVLTYQAYNNYPDDGATGKSLYDYNSHGAQTVSGKPNAVQVSFDRPYSGDGSGLFFNWDVYFINWAERMGYDFAYATDIDIHARPSMLLSYRGLLSIGHDEYWTQAMYDAAESARNAGVNLAFFGANDILWQVRLQPSAAGVPDRVEICYRDAKLDPEPNAELKTVKWRSAPVNRPEQALMGVQYIAPVQHAGTAPFVVENTGHWIYAGTELHAGDKLSSIVGYEVDRAFNEYPDPPGTGWTILSASPFVAEDGKYEVSNASIYQAPGGAWVFAAGTMSWSWALDRESYIDSNIQKMTANILNTFLTGVPPG